MPDLAYSRSIINKSRKAGIGAGFPLALSVDTMQNTTVRIVTDP
jgi:hypothetical protein